MVIKISSWSLKADFVFWFLVISLAASPLLSRPTFSPSTAPRNSRAPDNLPVQN